MKVRDYPGLYAAADEASLRAQRIHVWLIHAELGFVLIAAGIAALRLVVDPSGSFSATVIAAALVVAIGLRTGNRLRRYDKTWFDGRAVAESVKSATWRFAMLMEPYDGTDSEATAQFVKALDALLAERRDLASQIEVASDSHVVGPSLAALRALPIDERLSRYLTERVRDQFEWYESRSRANRRGATVWFWAGWLAQILAVIAAILAVSVPVAFSVIGFLSSVAAAATAWAQLGRHDELGRSYALAAAELSLIKAALESVDPSDAADLDEKLRDAEGAISREHTMWIAKRA